MKNRTTGRIDGMVALLMALSRAIVYREEISYYDTYEIIELQW